MASGIRQLSRYSMPVVGSGSVFGVGGFEVENIARPLGAGYALMMVDEWTPQGVQEAVQHTKEYGAYKVLNTLTSKLEELAPTKRQTQEAGTTKEVLDKLFGKGFITSGEVNQFVQLATKEKVEFLKEKIEERLAPIEQDVQSFIKKTNPNLGITGFINRQLGFLTTDRQEAISSGDFEATIAKVDPTVRKLLEATGIDIVVSNEDVGKTMGRSYASIAVSISGASRVVFDNTKRSFGDASAVDEELIHTADNLLGALHDEFKVAGSFTKDATFAQAIYQDISYKNGSRGIIDPKLPEEERERILMARIILNSMGKTSPLLYEGKALNLEMLPGIMEAVRKIDAGEITVQQRENGDETRPMVNVVVQGPASKYFPSLLGERDIVRDDGTVVPKQNQITRFHDVCEKVTELALGSRHHGVVVESHEKAHAASVPVVDRPHVLTAFEGEQATPAITQNIKK